MKVIKNYKILAMFALTIIMLVSGCVYGFHIRPSKISQRCLWIEDTEENINKNFKNLNIEDGSLFEEYQIDLRQKRIQELKEDPVGYRKASQDEYYECLSELTHTEKYNNEDTVSFSDEYLSNRLVCDRSERLNNDPKFDRALSLIQERVRQGENGRSFWSNYNFFPSQLVNCIKIESSNTRRDGAEGYFNPKDENIKSNYFPVYVDYVGYEWADDLTTAMLLTHEITHVQQYINRYNGDDLDEYEDQGRIMCLNDEVSAFYSQLMLVSELNDEEQKSLYSRILIDSDLHPQLKILAVLDTSLTLETLKESNYIAYACDIYDQDCIRSKINGEIYDLLDQSGIYDEQCGDRL